MKNKFIALLGVIPTINFLPHTNNFSYSYVIKANSTSVADMLVLYDVKQEFISRYNKLVLSVNEGYHEQIVKDNINSFIDSNL